MTHPRVNNERHVLMLASMCMINERHCHTIGMYDRGG